MKSHIRQRMAVAVAARDAVATNLPGPQTPEAKAAVRWNSYRHGLTGQLLRVPADERPFHDRIAAGFLERFQPVDEFEAQLVQKLIDDNWRLNTCAALESALFADGDVSYRRAQPADNAVGDVLTRAVTWQKQGNSFERLGRYETHIHRRFLRNLQALEDAQAARRANESAKQTLDSKPDTAKTDLFRKIAASAPALTAGSKSPSE